MRTPHSRVIPAVMALAAFAAACSDQPLPTGTRSAMRNAATPIQTDGTARLVGVAQFGIEMEINGTFRPNEPITIKATASAKVASADFELSVVAPEVEVLRVSPVENFRIPVNRAYERLAALRQPLGRGQLAVATGAFSVQHPGYYRVVAVAKDVSEKAHTVVEDGQNIHRLATLERWILVTEDGGQVTIGFDESVLPDRVIPQPGPFTYWPALHPLLARTSRAEASIFDVLERPALRLLRTIAELLPSSPAIPTVVLSDMTYTAKYYNRSTEQNEVLPFAKAKITEIEVDQFGEEDRSTYWRTADANGQFTVDCLDDAPSAIYQGFNLELFAEGDNVKVVHDGQSSAKIATTGDDFDDCQANQNLSRDVVSTDDNQARVFRNIALSLDKAEDTFIDTRGQVKVVLDTTCNPCTSQYDAGTDEIEINDEPEASSTVGIWSGFGTFGHAHEAGHAYQNKALGGLFRDPGCSPHPPVGDESSMGCALSEGFATFFAEFTLADADVHDLENGDDEVSTAEDGAIVEIGVAAVLWDLVDSTNETAFDALAVSAGYLGDVVETCDVKEGSTWKRPNGIDHLIFCFEQEIDSAVTGSSVYFPARSSHPNDFRESATEPSGLTKQKVRDIWTHNLYNE